MKVQNQNDERIFKSLIYSLGIINIKY